MSACQTVTERCVRFFFRQIFGRCFLGGGGIWALREQISAEKQKQKNHPSSTGRQGNHRTTCANLRYISQKRRELLGYVGKTRVIRVRVVAF